MSRVSDDELLSICVQGVEDSAGWYNTELSDERAKALDRYLGEPLGNEQEGRSHVRTREVFDTIQWILPSLVRLFADTDNLVKFEPVGPEDEEQARQETETVNHIFWQKNRGFYNLLTFLTDGLLSKTGILKVWWDDKKDEEREEYSGLDDLDLAQLMNDPEWSREVLEYEQREDGHHVVFKSERDKGQVRIEPVTPEEFGVERGARSPYAKDCTFSYHRSRKTRSELIATGYDRKLVESLPVDDYAHSEEQLARRHLDGEERDIFTAHPSMDRIWVTECYIRVDRDDDGIAELLKVTMATGAVAASGATLLDVEEVDRVPFATFSPIILTHKFYGLSIADIVRDLQEIKTALLRGTLDAMYLANNREVAVNERVNLDDFMVSRPGGIKRTKGNEPPAQHIFPIPSQPVPTETFGLLEYLDQLRKQRTGAGEDSPALDKNSLANVNPTVAAIAYDASRQKIELLARIVAEIGLVPLFRDIHELTAKHSHKEMTIRLRGGWQRVDPQEWKQRDDVRVQVGIGLASRERRLLSLEQLIAKQMEVGANGGMGQLVMPDQIYSSLADWTEALGLEPSRAWTDPRTLPPEQPQPDPNMLMLQAQMQIEGAKNQTAQQKLQLDAFRAKTEHQVKLAEFQLRRMEAEQKAEVERLRAEMAALKGASDTEKAALDAEFKRAELELKATTEKQRMVSDWYKAQLDSATRLTVEQMRQLGMDVEADAREAQIRADQEAENQRKAEQDAVYRQVDEERRMRQKREAERDEARQAIQMLTDTVNALREEANAPKIIERDELGRAIRIGGKDIKRNALDLIESIG